jgi:hypothetical protein
MELSDHRGSAHFPPLTRIVVGDNTTSTTYSAVRDISMSISTCPIATVEVPVGQVWQLLADPYNYALWWDAETCSVEPAGPAMSGQRISARTRALGKDWDVQNTVASTELDKRALDLTTQLPFGIMVNSHIVCGTLEVAG